MSLLPPLYLKFPTFCIIGPQIINSSPSLPPKNVKNENWQYRASLVFCEDTRFVESILCVLFLLSDIVLGEIEQKP